MNQPEAVQQLRLPQHVAIIMDGNGRWAAQRGEPRAFGHRAGVRAARAVVRAAGNVGVEFLSLFAFSQENWGRPRSEVSLLMQLFLNTLRGELKELQRNNVRLRFLGTHDSFPDALQQEMRAAEQATAAKDGLKLNIAVGYGGQWDILNAAQQLAAQGTQITAEQMNQTLQTQGQPDPDLLIRTGGERRISNFMLWQMAYTELYFCDTLWPDFDRAALEDALAWIGVRDRRFGKLSAAGSACKS